MAWTYNGLLYTSGRHFSQMLKYGGYPVYTIRKGKTKMLNVVSKRLSRIF